MRHWHLISASLRLPRRLCCATSRRSDFDFDEPTRERGEWRGHVAAILGTCRCQNARRAPPFRYMSRSVRLLAERRKTGEKLACHPNGCVAARDCGNPPRSAKTRKRRATSLSWPPGSLRLVAQAPGRGQAQSWPETLSMVTRCASATPWHFGQLAGYLSRR